LQNDIEVVVGRRDYSRETDHLDLHWEPSYCVGQNLYRLKPQFDDAVSQNNCNPEFQLLFQLMHMLGTASPRLSHVVDILSIRKQFLVEEADIKKLEEELVGTVFCANLYNVIIEFSLSFPNTKTGLLEFLRDRGI